MHQEHRFSDLGVFRETINQLEASVVVTDLPGNIVYVNPFFEKNTGYLFSEVEGKNPRILQSGYQDRSIYVELWNTISSGKSWKGEFQNKRKDGSLFWEKVNITPMRGESGEINYFVAIKIDITKDKEEEKVAARREALLNEIQDLSLTGGWEYEVATKKMYWTDQLYQIHGLEKGAVTNYVEESLARYHPEDREKIKNVFSQLLKDGSEYDLKARFIDKAGNEKWIRTKTRCVKDDDGTVIKLIGSIRDITETVLVDEKLKQTEKSYKVLFEQSSDPKLIEKDGKVIACNSAAIIALNYDSEEDLIKRPFLELSPKYQANGFESKEFWQRILTTVKTEGYYKCEWHYLRKDGAQVPFELMITHINNNGDSFNYVVLRDISKRKLIEQNLRDAYEERGILLSEIHHRVKNNLAVISGLIQLQQMNTDDPELYLHLSKSVNRINSIALIHEQLYKSDNFSDMSLVENIKTQLESIQEMFAGNSDATIKHELELENVSVGITQALPIGLLINEILTNSFKYAFKYRREGTIKICLKECNGLVHLNIGDDGIGIDKKRFSERNSLGKKLIESLLAQLDAEYEIDFESGLSYNIKFAKVEYLSYK